jgi:hypothetical protein
MKKTILFLLIVLICNSAFAQNIICKGTDKIVDTDVNGNVACQGHDGSIYIVKNK